MATSKSRTVAQLIDQVIRENRPGEYLLYGIAVTCVAGGMFALVWGVIHGQNVSTVCGAVTNVFFWPAMSRASQTRRESVAIRLSETPLSQAATAEDAARMLAEFFRTTLGSADTLRSSTGDVHLTNPSQARTP